VDPITSSRSMSSLSISITSSRSISRGSAMIMKSTRHESCAGDRQGGFHPVAVGISDRDSDSARTRARLRRILPVLVAYSERP
jgi:hypothetical protein